MLLAEHEQSMNLLQSYLPQSNLFFLFTSKTAWVTKINSSFTVIDLMLHSMSDRDESLALSAAEFWRLLSEHPDLCRTVVIQHLPKILPVLLTKYDTDLLCVLITRSRMIFTEDELRNFGEDENIHLEDKNEDINPSWVKVNFFFSCVTYGFRSWNCRKFALSSRF